MEKLIIPYPDFQMGELIDPEQHDTNNLYITNKINEFVEYVNNLLTPEGGVKVGIKPIQPFASTNVQAVLEELVGRLRATQLELSGGSLIGMPNLKKIAGTNVEAQLRALDEMLNTAYVITSSIANGAITTDKIGAKQVTSEKMADNSITNDKLTSNSVSTDNIQNNAITGSKLSPNTVNFNHLGGVLKEKLPDNVLSAMIRNHVENNTELKHISLVDEVPEDLNGFGLIVKNDGAHRDVPGKPTIDDLTQQLAQTKSKIFNKTILNHAQQKASASIVDDDVAGAVWTTLRIIAQDYSIPITCATVPKFVVDGHSDGKAFTGETLTLEQMRTLQRDYKFEFIPHTYSHPRLTDLTEEQIDEELRTCQEWLIENGFSGYTAIVYPYGAENATVRKVARRYFDAGFDTDDGLGTAVGVPISNQYAIRRVFDTYGVEKAKQAIDDAVVNNKWVIFGTHCWYDDFSMDELREVVEYALSQGVEFVTIEEGLNRFGNVIDITDGVSTFKVGADGKVNLGLNIESANTHTVNNVLADFTANAVTYTPITYAEAQNPGYPIKQGGILKTYRVSSSSGSYYQEYEGVTTNSTQNLGRIDTYKRFWLNSAWTEWEGINISLDLQNGWSGTLTCSKRDDKVSLIGNLTVGTVTAGTIFSQLPVGYRPGVIATVHFYNLAKLTSDIGIIISDTGNIAIRLPASTNVAQGDNIRFNVVFAI